MVSVLLSVYFKEKALFLEQSLNSIFQQTLLPNEVILVKDGSLTNDLEDVIAAFSERYEILKVVSLPINKGLANALNEGLAYCSNDIVARMDTDDIAKNDRFEKQYEVFLNDSKIDVVGSWIDEFEVDQTCVSSTRKLPEYHKDIFEFAKKRNPINHPVVMFKKSAVLSVGGYKHFYLFEDYYLWVRMLLNGSKFYNIQESLLYFRFSSEMFMRRGGWKYAISELKFQYVLKNLGFINTVVFIHNVSLRFISRIIPNCLRILLYKKIIRK